MIRIMYYDNSYDMVKAFRLDDLIPKGKIAKFLRSDGWVTVGVDPIRSGKSENYHGPERRKLGNAPLIDVPEILVPHSDADLDIYIPNRGNQETGGFISEL